MAVGVVFNQQADILLTRRPKHVHQGGLWEFPGGKVEEGETVLQALARELKEEIGIQVLHSQPLIKIFYDYTDKQVLLDVFKILTYTGIASPCEGQAMQWVAEQQLNEFAFPVANLPIVKAVQLPSFYAILEGNSVEQALNNWLSILQLGITMVQIRVKSLSITEVQQVVAVVMADSLPRKIRVLINSDLPIFISKVGGIHLSSRALLACRCKPLDYQWVAASCHNLEELRYAEQLGVDFAVLAPVLSTTTHPGQAVLGWEAFTALVSQVNLPVYALGGLGRADLQQALSAGGQGIAGISAFLSN